MGLPSDDKAKTNDHALDALTEYADRKQEGEGQKVEKNNHESKLSRACVYD